MTFTYKFYDKAEDERYVDIQSFEGDSEQDVKDAVIEYCDTYGYEAFVLVQPKQKKQWTEEEIRSLVQTNDKVLYGALKKLYGEQTADEKACKETKNNNGVGFNSVDAPFLTSVAEFLLKVGYLTDKQKAVARKKLAKYNKQLTRLANA